MLVTVIAVALSTGRAAAVPPERAIPIDNPDLVAACGLDIHMILDESGSVGIHAGVVRRAFNAFTSALNNTGSRIAVSEFSTVADLPLSGAARNTYTTVTDATRGGHVRALHPQRLPAGRGHELGGRPADGPLLPASPERAAAAPDRVHHRRRPERGHQGHCESDRLRDQGPARPLPGPGAVRQQPGQGRGRPERERREGAGIAHPGDRGRRRAQQPVVAGPDHRRVRRRCVLRLRHVRHRDATTSIAWRTSTTWRTRCARLRSGCARRRSRCASSSISRPTRARTTSFPLRTGT